MYHHSFNGTAIVGFNSVHLLAQNLLVGPFLAHKHSRPFSLMGVQGIIKQKVLDYCFVKFNFSLLKTS